MMEKKNIKLLLAKCKLIDSCNAMKLNGLSLGGLENRAIQLERQQNEHIKRGTKFSETAYNKWQYEVGEVIDELTAILDKEL